MRSFRLIPDDTHIQFMRYQYWAYAFSGLLVLLTLVLVPVLYSLIEGAKGRVARRRSSTPSDAPSIPGTRSPEEPAPADPEGPGRNGEVEPVGPGLRSKGRRRGRRDPG